MEPTEQPHAQLQEFRLGPSPEAKLGKICEELEENLEVAEELEEDQDFEETEQQKQPMRRCCNRGKKIRRDVRYRLTRSQPGL